MTTSKTEWSLGWRVVVAAACGIGTTWHFFQIVAGLFIIPMQTDFGWSRSQVSIGPMGGMISIVFYPLAGAIIDRYGPRRVALLGMVLLCLGFLMYAIVPANPIIFYGVTAYLAIIGSISNQIVFAKGLATWFVRRFGTAIGLMMTGVTVTSALGIPLLAAIIGHFGWRSGFIALAGIVAIVGLPINLLWFRAQEDPPPASGVADPQMGDASIRDAVRDSRFWLLGASVGSAAIPVGGFLAHLQPLLVGSGVSTERAAVFGSVFVIAVGAGRIVAGLLLDRVYPTLVASTSLCLSALGVVFLALLSPTNSPWILTAGAISMIGLAQGAESDYISYFTLRLFGLLNFSKLVGLLAIAVGAGIAIGGFSFAALFDHYGSYRIAVLASAAMFLFAALLFAFLRVPRLTRPTEDLRVVLAIAPKN